MAPFLAHRLRTRLLLISLIGLLPALGVIAYTQAIERRYVQRRALEDNLRLVRLAARQPGAVVEGAQHLLQTLAQIPKLSRHRTACQSVLRNVVRDQPGYTNLFVVDRRGEGLCSSRLDDGPLSMSDRPWFQRVMRTRAATVGDYQISRATGHPDIIVAVPVLGPKGEVELVLGAGLTLELLGGVVSSVTLPERATLTLFDANRTVLARHPDGARWVGQTTPIALAETTTAKFVEAPGVDGVRRLYVTVPIETTPADRLFLGMGVERTAAFAAVDRLLWRQLALLGFAAIVAMVFGLVGGELFVLRPIRALGSVADRLAAGELGARAQLDRAVPGLSELGDAVNTMAVAHEARERERDDAETRLRTAEQRLRQSQKMEAVGQLAGGIAHDFNNLLTVVTGYAEMAMGELGASHPVAGSIDEIAKAGARAAALTRQLLAFSRTQVLAPVVIDPHALVINVQALLRRVIGEHIELAIENEGDIGAVRVDPNQLEQVLLNLAVNARDAMPEGGMLTIATRAAQVDAARPHGQVAAGRYIVIAVSDTGRGMDRETQSRIFEPFFTTKGPAEGTGLGLAMVYGIVRQSGGDITVISAPGAGSTFSVYLPWVGDALTTAVEPAEDHVTGGSETILVAEDEPAVRRLTSTALRRGGYTVLEAGSGAEALTVHAAHGSVALLVTDVVMPKMSGLVLAAQLSVRQPGLKVLCVSGYSVKAVTAAGAMPWPFLAKPFVLTTLLARVRELLDA